MASSSVGFSWSGVSITEDGPYYLQAVDGWDSPSDGSADDVPVAAGHGSILTRMTRKARTVNIEGVCVSETDRDSLFNALADACGVGFGNGDLAPDLTGSVAGRSLSAPAQLQRYAPKVEQSRWDGGVFGWALQFRCPDPLRYASSGTLTVPFTVPTQGITFGISGSWVFPADPTGGRVSPFNTGNAPAPVVFQMVGPVLSPGFAVLETGKQVQFSFNLAAGDVLTVDTAQGVSLLNGEFRSPTTSSALLTDMQIPAASGCTVQALGTPQAGAPTLSVRFRPAFW